MRDSVCGRVVCTLFASGANDSTPSRVGVMLCLTTAWTNIRWTAQQASRVHHSLTTRFPTTPIPMDSTAHLARSFTDAQDIPDSHGGEPSHNTTGNSSQPSEMNEPSMEVTTPPTGIQEIPAAQST